MQAAEVIVDGRGGRIEVWPNGNPANGAHYRFEWFLAPGAAGLPEHFHPHQEERLQVVSGRLLVRLDGQAIPLGPGDRLVIPAGTRHTCGNDVSAETHVREEFVPGLAMHRFYEALYAIDRSAHGLGRLAGWAVLWSREPEHIGFRRPARLLIRLTAGLASRLGYRAPA
jgi:mannose-6-phosphate isomerase-like protein (cupin superfamily)